MAAKTPTRQSSRHPVAPTRPLIGITTDYLTPKNNSPYTRANVGYVDSILNAGGLPILLPPLKKDNYPELDIYLKMISGIIFTGGQDLDPRKYGQQLTSATQLMAPRREDCERLLLQKVFDRKMPILGIGMGMQLINLYHGGTLFQHLPTENPKAMPHSDPSGYPHRHMVNIEEGTLLEEIYGTGEQRVNSTHHQAVNQLGRKLRVSAKANDGVIEAIETTDASWFCVGLQWHPEDETASALDQQIFECFVQSATRFVEVPMLAAA
ncbi:gamma-glutamyl-gamma-aminobutyrate hydrolase family protein [Limnoglobus roseus]|uniref:Peptidase C26 n=1 Tax=Limnoglobus roseus TaxID=2598579 RepID=A0A5C1ASE3_9BACT|nr:gamma-glutamyl-gamma-aminobutyrate hydrolase family protein [Limnoglobus roseus]QEL21077.1 peptidase C26 [Limnoglobus roseus]